MKKNKGFSLIELMIVVAIIGILSLIVFPFYNNYMFKVRVTEVINNLTPIMTNAQISSLSGSGGIDFNEIAKTDSDYGEYCITGTGQLYGMMNIANDKLGYLGINPEFVDYISIQGMTDKKCNNNAMDLTGNDILRIDIYFNSKFTNIGSTNRWENSIALLIPSENPDNNYNSNNYKNQNKQYNDSVSRVFCGVQTLSILVDKLPYVCKQYIITSADEGRLGSDVHDIKDYL